MPCLTHDGAKVWNTLAIAEYLNEIKPEAGLLPADRVARAHCRSICGEMNSGFANLRSALPMNLKAHFPGYKIWAGAQPDIDRIVDDLARVPGDATAARTCSARSAAWPTRCTRRWSRASSPTTCKLDAACAAYCQTIMAMPEMKEWIAAAQAEPDEIDELDMEF